MPITFDEPQVAQPILSTSTTGLEPTPIREGKEDSILWAAFQSENAMLAGIDLLTRDRPKPEPGFDALAVLKEDKDMLDNHAPRFVGVTSTKEYIDTRARIKQEEANRQLLDGAGFLGVVAQLAAGMLDPTVFIPGTLGVKAGRAGLVLKGALSGAALTGGGAAIQELMLQGAQETRTLADAAVSVGAATLIGGILGSAVGFLTKADMERIATQIETGNDIHARSPAFTPASVGAAASREDSQGVASALGAEKLRFGPVTRQLDSEFQASRNIMRDLSDAGLELKENEAGIPTSEGGTVENRLRMRYGGLGEALPRLDELYSQYFLGDVPSVAPGITARVGSEWARLTGSLNGRLTAKEWREEVANAMDNMDQHPIPSVAAAAKEMREKVYDPLYKEAVKVGLLNGDEADNLPGALSYLNRMYLTDKIVAQRDEWSKILVDHIQETLGSDFKKAFADMREKMDRATQRAADLRLTGEGREIEKERVLGELARLQDMNEAHLERQDQLSELVARARAGDEEARAAARALRAEGGEEFRSFAKERARLRGRLRDIEGSVGALEDKSIKMLDAVSEIEERNERGLRRLVKRVQGIEKKLDKLDDEGLDEEITKLKNGFEDLARRYDKGEERLVKLARDITTEDGKFAGEPLPEKGVVPANMAPDGTIYVGKPNGVHFMIDEQYADKVRKDLKIQPGESTWKKTGFVTPTGEFLDRKEAFEWVTKNEKAVKPSENMADGTLDALDYREQVPEGRRAQGQSINPDIVQVVKLGEQQAAKFQKLTKIAEKLEKAEGFDRVAAREVLQEAITDLIGEAENAIYSRALREQRLRAAIAKINPEDLAKNIEGIEAKAKAQKAGLADKLRTQTEDFDLDTGFADFSGFAQEVADEITNKILHNSTLRLPGIDLVVGPRGPLMKRVLDISNTKLVDKNGESFLERDIERLSRAYTRTMAPDIEVQSKFGSLTLEDQIKGIQDEFNTKVAAAETDKERIRLDKEYKQAVRDINAVVGRLRHTYALPDNPQGLTHRLANTFMALNYLRLLGGMTLSAIPDLGRPVMVNGLVSTFRDGFVPLVTNFQQTRLVMREVKLAGTALDMILDTRNQALADTFLDWQRGTKFEKGLEWASNRMGLVSLMAPWNAAMKQFAGVVSISRLLQSADAVVKGTAKDRDIRFLAAAGIDQNMASRIIQQFEGPGKGSKDGGVYLPNTESWDDKQAVEAFRTAIVREVDRTIVTPGADKPLWMSTELGRVLGQFKGFGMASVSRTLVAGLQQRDAAFLNGVLLSVALGGMSWGLKQMAAGGETEQKMRNANLTKWAIEAVNASGTLAIFSDVLNIAERTPLRPVSRLTGEKPNKSSAADIVAQLGGPSVDLMKNIAQVGSGLIQADPTQGDVKALRRSLPYQNIFYLRRMFDSVQDGMVQQLGLPKNRGER